MDLNFNGLNEEEVIKSRELNGTNEIIEQKSETFLPKSAKKSSNISGIQYQLGPISNVYPLSVRKLLARPPKLLFFSKTCTSFPDLAE